MSETILICDKCGGEAYRVGEDALDYCSECGVVEGLTHEEINDNDGDAFSDFLEELRTV